MGGREAQRRPPPARKRRSDGLPPADGRAPRPPCGAGLEEAMVAVGSTCAAAWPRRRAATLAVMTFNGPKGARVKLLLGLPRGEAEGVAMAVCGFDSALEIGRAHV